MPEKPTVYLETTIVSYLAGRPSRDVIVLGHQQITRDWWDTRLPKFEAFISDVILDEALQGDAELARKRRDLLEPFGRLEVTADVEALTLVYLSRRLVPAEEYVDALHIALASVHGIDYLLTWNCAHIASAAVRRRILEINLSEGVGIPMICTPEELMEV